MSEHGPDHWTTSQVTPNLRFVLRDERRILQQRWRVTEDKGGPFGGVNLRYEWRDVPLVEEE